MVVSTRVNEAGKLEALGHCALHMERHTQSLSRLLRSVCLTGARRTRNPHIGISAVSRLATQDANERLKHGMLRSRSLTVLTVRALNLDKGRRHRPDCARNDGLNVSLDDAENGGDRKNARLNSSHTDISRT